MNENNVSTRSRLALAICEITDPLLDGDAQRIIPSHHHAKRKASAFRNLKHLFSSCGWIAGPTGNGESSQ